MEEKIETLAGRQAELTATVQQVRGRRRSSPSEPELTAAAAAQLLNAITPHGKEMTPPIIPSRDRPRKPSKEEKTEMVRVPIQYQSSGSNRGRATDDDDEE